MEEINNVDTIPQDVNESVNEEAQNLDTTPVQDVQSETPARELVKVKYLKEEKEIDPYSDEGKSYIQQGMDYTRIKTKYEETKPVVEFIERLAKQNSMNVDEYIKAVQEHERQQEIESLAQQKSLDPELAEELYILRQERLHREEANKRAEQENAKQQEYLDFLNAFPDVNAESIPESVWKIRADNPNISLTDAYYRHQFNELKSKVQAQEVNKRNAEASTGNINTDGNVSSDFISFEQFESKKSDRKWVVENLSKISKSREKW